MRIMPLAKQSQSTDSGVTHDMCHVDLKTHPANAKSATDINYLVVFIYFRDFNTKHQSKNFMMERKAGRYVPAFITKNQISWR